MTTGTARPAAILLPRQMVTRENRLLYLFVILVPLQSIYIEHFPGLGAGLNFLNVMFALTLFMAIRCRGGLVRGSGLNGWVMAYMAYGIFAVWKGMDFISEPDRPVQVMKDHLMAVSFLFLVQMSVRDWSTWRKLFVATLIPLPYIIYVVLDQNSAITSLHYTEELRIHGTFSELGANEMGAWFVTAALVTLGFAIGSRVSWRWRLMCLVASAMALTGVVLSYSRTAYVATLVAIALIIMMPRFRLRLVVPVVIVALILPLLLPQAVIERFESISIEEGERDLSTEHRFELWGIAWQEFRERPVFGMGFHTFHHEEVNPLAIDTHNLYLRELAEKGLVGFLITALMLWCILRLCWRGFRVALPGSGYHGFILGLTGAFVALLIGNVFGDRFTYLPMSAHFWVYVGLALRGLQLLGADQAQSAGGKRFGSSDRASFGLSQTGRY
jgi:putative inorganic carbon (hco3(-)) transporter